MASVLCSDFHLLFCVRVHAHMSTLKHLISIIQEWFFHVANDDKLLTSTDTSITDITINDTSWAIGGDVTATERALPACHGNFQNSQPALFEVHAIAGESVGGFGLAYTETRLTLELLRGILHTAA